MTFLMRIKGILPTGFTFGATSAIITNLGLITSLDYVTHPKPTIIGGILAIAIADNISDTLGIHIHQESEGLKTTKAMISTFSNYFTRVFVSLVFVPIISFLPIEAAVV